MAKNKTPKSDLTVHIEHIDDGASGAFFAPGADGKRLAEMTYLHADNGTLVIDHTEVKEALRGQGIGHTLLDEVVRYARKQEVKVDSTCPYAKEQLDKRSEQYSGVYGS